MITILSQRNRNLLSYAIIVPDILLSFIHQSLGNMRDLGKKTPIAYLSASVSSFAPSVLATLLTEYLQPSYYFRFALSPFSVYSRVTNCILVKPSILTHRLLHQHIDQGWFYRVRIHKDTFIPLQELPTHEKINRRFIWSDIEHMSP